MHPWGDTLVRTKGSPSWMPWFASVWAADRAMVWIILLVGRMVDVGLGDVFCTIPTYVE